MFFVIYVITNPAARKEILKNSRRCYICFEIGHTAHSCTWEYKCNKWNGKHNIGICTFEKATSRFENQINPSSNNLANSQGNVLLQTAYVKVGDLHSQKDTKVNILFDTGSQRSYISQELKDYLKLPVLRKERILIKVFGKKHTYVQTVEIVPLKLYTPTDHIHIEVICTPTICSDVLNQDINYVSTKYAHLTQLQLADYSSSNDKCVDVLIGVDYYYSCLLGEIKKGKENEPIAIKSHFGWIVCGFYENSSVNTNLNSVHMLRVNTESVNKFNKEFTAFLYLVNCLVMPPTPCN